MEISNVLHLNRLFLTFKDKTKEKEYTYYRYLYNNNNVRNSFILFPIIYLSILLYDIYIIEITNVLFIISKIIFSAVGIIIYFVYPKISFLKQNIYILLFLSFIYLSIILQFYFIPDATAKILYIIGYSLVVYATLFFLNLKFKDSVITIIVAQAIYYSIFIFCCSEELSVVIYFVLLLINSLIIFGAYQLELSNRKAFYYINKLEEENEKHVNLYNVLKDKQERINDDFYNHNEKNNILNEQHKRSILIVDDEQANLLYFEQVALKQRLNLYKAENGVEAIEIFKLNKLDIVLVIMDVRMPEMNGYEATDIIKGINKDVPVVLITAYPKNDIKGVNADMILSKPITPDELTKVIKKFIP